MTVWRAGMLAVCVDDTPCRQCGAFPPFAEGETLMVIEVIWPGKIGDDGFWANPADFDGIALCFMRGRICCGLPGEDEAWAAERFRPAVSDDQRCEEEFITLLNRFKPIKEPAGRPPPVVQGGRSKSLLSPAPLVSAAGRSAPTQSGFASSRGAKPLDNASRQFADSPDFLAPLHGGLDSRNGKQDHA